MLKLLPIVALGLALGFVGLNPASAVKTADASCTVMCDPGRF